MTAADPAETAVDRAADILHRHLGMRPDPTMLGRLRRCLRDEAASRSQDPAAYVETLDVDRAARQSLFDRVTVQETAFFRHPGQFEALAQHVLPGLASPVTIWSAACANGQEAYSLAMVLEEQGTPGNVIATDVSTRALARTTAARYRDSELTGLSPARRARHLIAGPGDWEIHPAVRMRVTARHHNLVTDPLPEHLRRCQVVFCRNVLIYFSPAQATAFLTRLAEQLPAGAFLFLGYAETIWQVTDLFEPVKVGAAFEYHRRRGPAAPKRPVPGDGSEPAGTADVARRAPRLARLAAAHRPTSRRTRILEPVAVASPVSTLDLALTGQTAAARGDYPAAVTAFRKCVYLEPDDPMAHVHLGLALEASGDRSSAARAFQAARSALGRGATSDLDAALGGYRVEELLRLLDSKRDES
jgi:chemotaxis protein methyltransferase CheR